MCLWSLKQTIYLPCVEISQVDSFYATCDATKIYVTGEGCGYTRRMKMLDGYEMILIAIIHVKVKQDWISPGKTQSQARSLWPRHGGDPTRPDPC